MKLYLYILILFIVSSLIFAASSPANSNGKKDKKSVAGKSKSSASKPGQPIVKRSHKPAGGDKKGKKNSKKAAAAKNQKKSNKKNGKKANAAKSKKSAAAKNKANKNAKRNNRNVRSATNSTRALKSNEIAAGAFAAGVVLNFGTDVLNFDDAKGELVKTVPIKLNARPAGKVHVEISGANGIVIDKCTLDFDETNFNVVQNVQVRFLAKRCSRDRAINRSLTFKITLQDANKDFCTVTTEKLRVIKNCKRMGKCSVTGDPHLTTFDGEYVVFNDKVENRVYYLMNSKRGTSLQIKQYKCFKGGAQCISDIALRHYDHTMKIGVKRDASNGTDPFANGGFSESLPSGRLINVTRSGNKFNVKMNDGTVVRVTSRQMKRSNLWYINIFVSVPGTYFKQVSGLCGDFDGVRGNDAQINNALRAKPPVVPSNDNIFLCGKCKHAKINFSTKVCVPVPQPLGVCKTTTTTTTTTLPPVTHVDVCTTCTVSGTTEPYIPPTPYTSTYPPPTYTSTTPTSTVPPYSTTPTTPITTVTTSTKPTTSTTTTTPTTTVITYTTKPTTPVTTYTTVPITTPTYTTSYTTYSTVITTACNGYGCIPVPPYTTTYTYSTIISTPSPYPTGNPVYPTGGPVYPTVSPVNPTGNPTYPTTQVLSTTENRPYPTGTVPTSSVNSWTNAPVYPTGVPQPPSPITPSGKPAAECHPLLPCYTCQDCCPTHQGQHRHHKIRVTVVVDTE